MTLIDPNGLNPSGRERLQLPGFHNTSQSFDARSDSPVNQSDGRRRSGRRKLINKHTSGRPQEKGLTPLPGDSGEGNINDTLKVAGGQEDEHGEEPVSQVLHELAGSPPRPEIGNDEDWRYINGEWRQTPQGLAHIQPTEHEAQVTEILKLVQNNEWIKNYFLFDPAGRPKVSWVGQTADDYRVSALFEKGAAYREAIKPENMISVKQYETFRDCMAKIGQGLAVFGEYLSSPSCTPQEAGALIQLATRGQIPPNLLDNPEVYQYVIDNVLPFGRDKYDEIDPGRTSYGTSYEHVKEGGRKDRTADDTLEEWLVQEKSYSPETRAQGRQALVAIMRNFEANSRNDGAWTASNPKLVEYERALARAERRNFSGRGFMSAEAARAFGLTPENIEQTKAHGLYINPEMNIDEVRKIREEEVARMRKQGIKLVNPWQDRMRPQ